MRGRRTLTVMLLFAGLSIVLVPNLCCARRLGELLPHPGDPPLSRDDPGHGSTVELRFLGVAGWILRRGDAAIMTAPFFSNPSLLRVSFGRIEAVPERIEPHLPPVEDVAAILVGHAHYDHLMDVPYVAAVRAPKATVYGSDTMTRILAAVPELSGRVVSVEATAASGDSPGEWTTVADGRIRFMPVRSEHAPHFMGIKFYGGQVTEDLARLPRRASGWREGTTLAYVIDFLGRDGLPEARIHFQDSASNAPIGIPPDLGDGKGFDAVIFTGASFHEVRGYPETLLSRLHPSRAFMSHWEDFFVPPGELLVVRATNIGKLVKRLEGSLPEGCELLLAGPGATYRLHSR